MGDYADESKRTLWCGNLHEKVTEELLYELFVQAGPLERIKLISKGSSYAFIVFRHDVSVPYALQIMKDVELFRRRINLQYRNKSDAVTESASPFHRSMSEPVLQNSSPARDYWGQRPSDGGRERSRERRGRFEQGNDSWNDSNRRHGRDRSRGNQRDDRGHRDEEFRRPSKATELSSQIQMNLANERALSAQWQFQQMALQMQPAAPWQQPRGRRW